MIPIAKPNLGEEEKRAVLEVLESGQYAQGPKVAGDRWRWLVPKSTPACGRSDGGLGSPSASDRPAVGRLCGTD